MNHFFRRQTNLDFVERNPLKHNYLLKKPKTHEPSEASLSRESTGENEAQIDDPVREKRRFELFIDLVWVGIIGNLADHFKDQAYSPDTTDTVGRAVTEFIILFLLAWRMWKFLQDYMSKYRTNDLVERAFVVWALVLAMGYGNNAPYLFDDTDPSELPVTIYLIYKGSLFLVEGYYAMHLPHIRRRVMLQSALSVPILGLWIATYYYRYPRRAALAIAAVALEYWTASFIETPLAARLIRDERKEILNTDHWVERMQDFFIIILGEGVLNLIRGSPLGRGITAQAAAGICALWIYYILSCLFFNGDSSRRYIHAMRRTWWRRVIWLSFHVSMFASTIILGVSIGYLISNPFANAIDPSHGEDEEKHKFALSIYSAKWITATTLSMILFQLTKIAILNRSLDPPHTLKVNNRYLRLLPRFIVIAVTICLPIDRGMNGITMMSIIISVMIPCLLWEWATSLDSGGGFVEPKHFGSWPS